MAAFVELFAAALSLFTLTSVPVQGRGGQKTDHILQLSRFTNLEDGNVLVGMLWTVILSSLVTLLGVPAALYNL